MKPLVAIVGRPNVGKSTLFNKLIGHRVAIVEDLPGTTRDRIYEDSEWNGRTFTLVDTGGMELAGETSFSKQIMAQVQLAIEEADVIVFMVDTRDGVTASDREVAEMLRLSKKPVVLGANKADNATQRQEAVEFYELGLGEPITLSSVSGTGSGDLLDAVTDKLPPADEDEDEDAFEGIPRIAIVGRPNTGKSSLVNSILGQERVIVSEIPGTTRDTIDTEVEHDGRAVLLIDTAGIRRRGKIAPGVEKFSALRSHRAIDRADVAVLMIDGLEGVTAQDTHIAGYVHEAAKGIVVVVNKWDLVREKRREMERALAESEAQALAALGGEEADIRPDTRRTPLSERELEELDAKKYTRQLREALKFVPYAPIIFASAKTKYHIGDILDRALRIYDTRQLRVPTAQLNEVVKDAYQRHHPSFVQGRVLRVYYGTQAEVNPPTFIFFVNDPDLLHFSYERYLENRLREVFGFEGTPIRLLFRPRSQEVSDEKDQQRRAARKAATKAKRH